MLDLITIFSLFCMIVIGAIAIWHFIGNDINKVCWSKDGYSVRLLDYRVRYDCYTEITFEKEMPNVGMNEFEWYINDERVKVDVISWDRRTLVIRYEGKKEHLKDLRCVLKG